MHESELRDLLRRNDEREEVELAPSQLARLRIELGFDRPDHNACLPHATTEISVLNLSDIKGRTDERSRRRLPWLSAAAVLLIVGASLVFVGNRRSDSSRVATSIADDTSEPLVLRQPPSPEQQFCATTFAELVEAVDVWDGIENWSFLTDSRAPEPDLSVIAHHVQVELHHLNGRTGSAPELPAIWSDQQGTISVSGELRRSVYNTVLDSINDSLWQIEAPEVADRYSSCDVGALRDASPDLSSTASE